MPVKLNQYWTVLPGKTEEYNKFILKKFIPGVNQLGMHTGAVWSVLVGAYSEIMFESVANDLDLIEKALKDKNYKELKGELLNYVKKYKFIFCRLQGTFSDFLTIWSFSGTVV